MRKENAFAALEKDIMNTAISENEKSKMLRNLMRLKNQKINIMVTGATGSGKSSTINALLGAEVARVGVGVAPETMEIKKYEVDNLVLWDTPGLGDGKEADIRHSKRIIDKLAETDGKGNALIDLVLVVLDGSSRDLGTSYELINKVIIPNMGEKNANRVLVAINQADMAMKGRNWEREKNAPNPQLKEFLEEKVRSVKRRIKEGTGVTIDPVYYSAGYKEEGGIQNKPYNLAKLLAYVVKAMPLEKRTVYEPEEYEEEEDDYDLVGSLGSFFPYEDDDDCSYGRQSGGYIPSDCGEPPVAGVILGSAIRLLSSFFGW